MKRLMLVAAMAALAACSQAETEEPMAADTTAATATPEPAAVMAADGQPAPGKYKITTSDGKIFNEELMPDGNYVQTDEAGTVVETGTWVQKSAEEYCYTVDEQYREEGDTGAEQCNAEGIGEDGRWFSTNSEGETAYVERVTE